METLMTPEFLHPTEVEASELGTLNQNSVGSPIRRRQLFELHDLPWWPQLLRDFLTNVLVLTWGFPWITLRWKGRRVVPSFASLSTRVLCRLVDRTFGATSEDSPSYPSELRFVDLCSGAGGPWQHLPRLLQTRIADSAHDETAPVPVQVVLTDLYPSVQTDHADKVSFTAENDSVHYHSEPVDATNVPAELTGVRTMFGCFHHFTPELARQILQDAVSKGESVAVIETCERSLIQMIGAAFLMTPLALVTPLVYFKKTPWYVFWLTYVFPVTPLVTCFDGVVSCMRGYKPTEMLAVAASIEGSENYRWTAGKESFFGLFSLTYMTGRPVCDEPLGGEVVAAEAELAPLPR